MFSEKAVERYSGDFSTPLPDVLDWLEKESNLRTNHGRMVSGAITGRLLMFLSRLIIPSRVLEIGTFTGYSAICLAQGLPSNGVIDLIEVNDELKYLIEEGFDRAGISDKANLMIGDAIEILPGLKHMYDIVYIDANKREYSQYYDLVFPMVRCGGVIVADNVLWSGKVVGQEKENDAQTEALREFNSKVKKDHRTENFILPVRDGLNIIRKLV
jgi:predicted O-methyltransferase YrrM